MSLLNGPVAVSEFIQSKYFKKVHYFVRKIVLRAKISESYVSIFNISENKSKIVGSDIDYTSLCLCVICEIFKRKQMTNNKQT